MNKVQSWNIITLFCIFIFGFTAATMLKPDAEYSETENRSLAQMPPVTADTVFSGEFEADYETYLTDQFVLRDRWIGLKTSVERALLKQESKDIYFAKDGYLIEKHTGAFTSKTAQTNLQTLQKFLSTQAETFGADHVTAMLVPNAVDILRDKLPPFASPYNQEEYLAQAASMIGEDLWFDAGAVLRAHDTEELYYRTDHHWKTQAAFYVYQEWAKQNGLTVRQADEFEIETATDSFEGTIQSKLGIAARKDSIELYHFPDDPFYTVRKNNSAKTGYSVYDYGALEKKSKYDVFFGGNDARVTINTKADNGRKLLVIKDSYAHCFVPFLLKDFETIDMLDIRYYNQKISDLIAQEGYTDLLFLYNASGFAEEMSIGRLAY